MNNLSQQTSLDPIGLCSTSSVRRALRHFKLRPTKRRGQNFIVDLHALQKIVMAAQLHPEDPVLEIGTGLGTLTAALAQQSSHVTSVENDQQMFLAARRLLSSIPNTTLLPGDFLSLDIKNTLGSLHSGPCVVVANLPYYATKPMLMRLVETRQFWKRALVTVQREVADRLCATPGTKAYGVLTIAVRLFSTVKVIENIAPSCFFPEPKVTSSIVQIEFHEKPRVTVQNHHLLMVLVEAAFAQRRKTLINSVSSRLHQLSRSEWQNVFHECSIDTGRRGETLSLDEFAAIANRLPAVINQSTND